MIAVAYIRVSTEEQASGGLSLADQEQRARDYAKHGGLGEIEVLRERGVNAHGRRSRGTELDAACGQLRQRDGDNLVALDVLK